MFRYDNITLRQKANVELHNKRGYNEAEWVFERALDFGLVDVKKLKPLKGKKLISEAFSFLSEYDVLISGAIVKKGWEQGDDWQPFIINAKDLLEDLNYDDAIAIRMGLYLLYQHHGLTTPKQTDFVFEMMPDFIDIEECNVKFEEDGSMTDEYIEQTSSINIKRYFSNLDKICVPLYPCSYSEYETAASKVINPKAKRICKAMSTIFEIGLDLNDVFGPIMNEDSEAQFIGMIVYMNRPQVTFLKNYTIRSDYAVLSEFIGEGPNLNTLALKEKSDLLYQSFYQLMSKDNE